MPEHELHERVRNYVTAKVPSLHDRPRAVIAVSGGADSIATAALLIESGVLVPEQPLIAHFDHRLRGDRAAARDRAAVDELCRRYAIECVVGAWDAPVAGEAAARDARYRFLAEAAHAFDARVIVTGHHAGDQAETVLMHAMRGAGLHGLSGMSSDAPLPLPHGDPPLRVARPMLSIARAELRAYADVLALPYVDDETNADTRFTRNRVRHDLLPAFERDAPDIRSSLLAIAEHARIAAAALDAIAAPVIASTGDPNIICVSRAALRTLTPEVAEHAYRLALVRLLGDARDFDRRHYATLVRASGARTGATFELPRGVLATVDAQEVIMSRGRIVVPAIDAELEQALPFAGVLGGWRISVTPCGEVDGADEQIVQLPADAVMRRRRPGDRITLANGQHKKLQDDFVDRKIPARLRDLTPVIAHGRDVLWTPYVVAVAGADSRRYAIEAKPVVSVPS